MVFFQESPCYFFRIHFPLNIRRDEFLQVYYRTYGFTIFMDTDAMQDIFVIFSFVLGQYLVSFPKFHLQQLYDLIP